MSASLTLGLGRPPFCPSLHLQVSPLDGLNHQLHLLHCFLWGFWGRWEVVVALDVVLLLFPLLYFTVWLMAISIRRCNGVDPLCRSNASRSLASARPSRYVSLIYTLWATLVHPAAN